MTEVMLVTEDGEERIVSYQEHVWEHTCGSQLFFLHEDGSTECSRCGGCDTPRWIPGSRVPES